LELFSALGITWFIIAIVNVQTTLKTRNNKGFWKGHFYALPSFVKLSGNLVRELVYPGMSTKLFNLK
jgi:hypothetical protein